MFQTPAQSTNHAVHCCHLPSLMCGVRSCCVLMIAPAGLFVVIAMNRQFAAEKAKGAVHPS